MPPAAITGMSTASTTCGTSENVDSPALADVSARFGALGHDGVGPGGLGLPGEARGGDDVDDDRAGSLEALGVAGRRTRARHDDAHALLEDDLDQPLDDRIVAVGPDVDQGDVDCERPAGLRPQGADLRAEIFGLHPSRAEDPERSGLTDRRRELVPADPGHAALEDGMSDAEKIDEGVGVHGTASP
jgi:hypothetical protein